MSRRIIGIVQLRRLFICTLLSITLVFGIYGIAAGAEFEEIWFSTAQYDYASDMTIKIEHPQVAPADGNISFLVELATVVPYQATVISIDIENSNNESVHQSALKMDLHRGDNQISFEWNSAAIPYGCYMLKLAIDFSDYFPVSHSVLPFRKVSTVEWKQEIENAKDILDSIEKPLQDFPDTVYGATLKTQYLISKSSVENASVAMEKQEWQKVDHFVNYLKKTCKSIHAGLVFGNKEGLSLGKAALPALKNLEIHDGAFFSDGQPVFLFGTELNGKESFLPKLEQLHQLGLNFAVKTIAVNETPEQISTELNNLMENATAESVAVSIQMNQDMIAGSIMDQWPDLLEPGFVNLAHEEFGALFTERLNAIARVLHEKPGVVALSLAQSPQFQYDSEEVRQQFVAHIKERYPDRIELNRLWRSHLADYDEITVWGDHPEYGYQNRRAFQYEWQSFQRELISSFLAKIDQELCQTAPDLPLMLTLPNTAFLPAETHTGVNREAAAWMMDINGCMATSGPCEALYAMNYPLSMFIIP